MIGISQLHLKFEAALLSIFWNFPIKHDDLHFLLVDNKLKKLRNFEKVQNFNNELVVIKVDKLRPFIFSKALTNN